MTNSDIVTTGRVGLLSQLLKYGPAWFLVVLLVGGIGYELHLFVQHVGPSLSAYLIASREIDEQNGANMALLSKAQKLTGEQHASMLAALTTLQVAVEQRSVEHENHVITLKELLGLMVDASDLMADVPVQRAEQLKLLEDMRQTNLKQAVLLEEIKEGIASLKETIEASGINGDP
jgi:hypothetical protein